MLPRDEKLLQMILTDFHTSKVGGHAGITRILKRISAQFYWPKMKEDIRKVIQECVMEM